MSSRVLRWVIVLVAVMALAGASYRVWEIEQISAVERNTADTFERHARQLTLGLADLRAALQAYVADGQVPEVWQKTASSLYQTATAQVASLQTLARSPEGQGAVEGAVEATAALTKIEARAREFLASSQRLSASDVVFSEAASQIGKIVHAIDTARGHESIHSATVLEGMRVRQLAFAGGAAALAFLALLLLLPVPRSRSAGDEAREDADAQPGNSLGIGRIASSPWPQDHHDEVAAGPAAIVESSLSAGRSISFAETAAVCTALAKVQEPRELPPLLERTAALLNAGGLVVWMPDGPKGTLRPALAHGYPPLTVTRMGTIAVDADNATAVAYRTGTAQVVPADAQGPGAVAAPLITAEGCSGVMAAEILPGTSADSARDAAIIIAAQLATLISPTNTGPRNE